MRILAKIKVSSTLLIFFLLLFSVKSEGQIENVIVERYYISDANDSTDTDGGKLEIGSITYRIFVDLKPGNRLLAIFGDKNHPLKFNSSEHFFNNIDGDTYAKDLKKTIYQYNTVALDTWLTLGQTAKPLSGKTTFGIPKDQDFDGSFIGGLNNDGGSASIPGGLLTNTISAIGIPLPVADGMDTMVFVPTNWSNYGIKDFLTGVDSTMFGALKKKSAFTGTNVIVRNSGVTGVIPEQNQILIAQLTTKGEFSFSINLEVEQLMDDVPTIFRYVANDSILMPGEKKSSFLSYPFPEPICGCKDSTYLEYNANFECANIDSCQHKIVFGCLDTMACNFDSIANFNIKELCCYPGYCGGREISIVCPKIRGNSIEVETHPNPVENSLFITVFSGIEKNISYYIYNYFGNEIYFENLGRRYSVLNEEFNTSALTSGIYLIKVVVGGEIVTKQFIKY